MRNSWDTDAAKSICIRDLEETQRLYDEQASQRLANVAALDDRLIELLVTVLIITVLAAGIFVWVLQKEIVASTMRMARVEPARTVGPRRLDRGRLLP